MIEIELTEPKNSVCECCGGVITNLTRFVCKDGDAFAIYHATFSENHRESGVLLAIGIDDDWESEGVSKNRVAFACKLSVNNDSYAVTITDKIDSPWQQSKVLGRMLDRDEALSHHWIEDVFHLTDHILSDDIVIKTFLEGETIH